MQEQMAHEPSHTATSGWPYPAVHVCHHLCEFMQMSSCCTRFLGMNHKEELTTETHLLFLLFPHHNLKLLFPFLCLWCFGFADGDRLCVHLASTAWTQTGGEGVGGEERRGLWRKRGNERDNKEREWICRKKEQATLNDWTVIKYLWTGNREQVNKHTYLFPWYVLVYLWRTTLLNLCFLAATCLLVHPVRTAKVLVKIKISAFWQTSSVCAWQCRKMLMCCGTTSLLWQWKRCISVQQPV